LAAYGFIEHDSNHGNHFDEEHELLPNIIEKIVTPRFSKILAASFNPYSVENARNTLSTLSDIEEFLDPSNPVITVSF
jgi:hypothetical protein